MGEATEIVATDVNMSAGALRKMKYDKQPILKYLIKSYYGKVDCVNQSYKCQLKKFLEQPWHFYGKL